MYELTANWAAVLAMAQDPDVDPQAIADTLEAIGGEIEEKAENTAIIMKELEAEAAKLKAEEQRLKDRRAKVENNIKDIKQRLFDAMKMTGKEKFKTELFSFSIAKNGGKIPVIVDVETADLPDDLVTIIEKPNLDAIAAYLEKHPESKYGHFGERGEHLNIK
jgi:hypothetical protein